MSLRKDPNLLGIQANLDQIGAHMRDHGVTPPAAPKGAEAKVPCSGHTEGLEVHRYWNGWYITAPSDYAQPPVRTVCSIESHPSSRYAAENERLAHLFAASPALLEACKLAHERIGELNKLTPREYQEGQGADDLAKLSAAIHLATGGQP